MTQRTYWKTQGTAIGLALAMVGGSAWAQDPIRISYIGAFTANEWHTEIVSGAEAAVAALPFEVDLRVVGPSDFDPVQQASIFNQEAQTKPDAMIIANVASALFVQPALDAQALGINVVWTNAAPTAEFATSMFMSADPKAQGLAAAQVIAATLEAKTGKKAAEIEGTFVVGLCVPGLATLENRIAGFRKGMSEVMPLVTIPTTVETKPDRTGNFAAWNQAIQANPGALGYADACEAGQQNTAKIIEDDKLDAVSVAFDTPAEVRDAIQRGVIPAAAPSNHFAQAYLSTYLTAMALHEGKPLPQGWVVVPGHVIDGSNVGTLIEAWNDPVKGLAAFFDADLQTAIAAANAGQTVASAEYDKAPE